jgi:hypothetical protein
VPLPRSMFDHPYGLENRQRFGGGEIEARGLLFFLDGVMEQKGARGDGNMSLHAIVGLMINWSTFAPRSRRLSPRMRPKFA